MRMEDTKERVKQSEPGGFHPFYLLSILYVIGNYMFPFLYVAVNKRLTDAHEGGMPAFWPLAVLFVIGIINLAVVAAYRKLHRILFLKCTVIMKYCLIPFYFIGAVCILLMVSFSKTTIGIQLFTQPFLVALYFFLGEIPMIGAAPFALAYIIKSRRAHVHGRALSVTACILQFVFLADVISVMVLALKEGRCVKWTKAAVIFLAIMLGITVLAWIGLRGILHLF